MKSLPPKVIREIYTKMDARTAYTFRKTCRDFNRLFLETPSTIRRFDSILSITWKGFYIEVMFKLPKIGRSVEANVSHSVCIWKGSDTGQEMFADSKSLKEHLRMNKNKPTDITAVDPVEMVVKIVSTLSTLLRFANVKMIGRIPIPQGIPAILDDRLLRMLTEILADDIVDQLHFYMVDFRFTWIDNWHRLLKTANAKVIRIIKCDFHALTLFTEDVVREGLKKTSSIKLQNNTSDDLANVGLQHLFGKDTIRSLEVHDPVDIQQIIGILETYYNDGCCIQQIEMQFVESAKEELVHYLDTICEGRSQESCEEHLDYKMSTRTGDRMATITVNDSQLQISINCN